MLDRLAAFIVGEGNWLPIAMTMALAAVAAGWNLDADRSRAARTQRAMNIFVGVTLLVMGLAHLAAVTVKLLQGTLAAGPVVLYLIGIAIVVPSSLLVVYAGGRSAALNIWMAVTLVLLGLINIPLAIPPLLSVAYGKYSRTRGGVWIIVTFVLVNLALFTGGMMFLLSGARTFEEFNRLR
ncbi:MAG TPA: hypothetical protein VFZ31_07370 [Vicinamibacterales bacterium]